MTILLQDLEVRLQTATPWQVKDNQDIVNGILELLRKNVNPIMAMYQLMNTHQGTMNWNSFIRELEVKAKTLNFDRKPYNIEEAIKDAAIFGMNDGKMK